MKVFISADIEGVAGVVLREECNKERPEYGKFAAQMTLEVITACEGAFAAGATEIVVKDGHGSATNIDISKMPKNVTLIRGKSGHPYNMMYGLDSSFDAVLFIGYHAGAGQDGSPLSHTNTGNSASIKLNGMQTSEFIINSYIASMEKVPVAFISGDAQICQEAKEFHPSIATVITKVGYGGSTSNIAPQTVLEEIKSTVEEALKKDRIQKTVFLPEKFEEIIQFKDHVHALKMSFYPGAERIDAHTIRLNTHNFMDIVVAHSFVLY